MAAHPSWPRACSSRRSRWHSVALRSAWRQARAAVSSAGEDTMTRPAIRCWRKPPGQLPLPGAGLVDPALLLLGGDDPLLVPLALGHPAGGAGVADLRRRPARWRRPPGAWTPSAPSPARRWPAAGTSTPCPRRSGARRRSGRPGGRSRRCGPCRSRRGGRQVPPAWSGSTLRPRGPGARPSSDRPTGAARRPLPAGRGLSAAARSPPGARRAGPAHWWPRTMHRPRWPRSPPGRRGRRRGGWPRCRWTSCSDW